MGASKRMIAKPISISPTGETSRAAARSVPAHVCARLRRWYIRRLCIEGGRTYLGRSASGHGIVTEGEAIHLDPAAKVSRGRSSYAVGKAIEAFQSQKAEKQMG